MAKAGLRPMRLDSQEKPDIPKNAPMLMASEVIPAQMIPCPLRYRVRSCSIDAFISSVAVVGKGNVASASALNVGRKIVCCKSTEKKAIPHSPTTPTKARSIPRIACRVIQPPPNRSPYEPSFFPTPVSAAAFAWSQDCGSANRRWMKTTRAAGTIPIRNNTRQALNPIDLTPSR